MKRVVVFLVALLLPIHSSGKDLPAKYVAALNEGVAGVSRGLIFHAPLNDNSAPLRLFKGTGSLTYTDADNVASVVAAGITIGSSATVLTMSTSGNVSGTAGTVSFIADVTTTTSNKYIIDLGSNRPIAMTESAPILDAYDGTNFNQTGLIWLSGEQHAIAVSWGGTEMKFCMDGGAVVTKPFDGNMDVEAVAYIGSSTAGASFIDGHVKQLRIYDGASSDAILRARCVK